MSGEKEQARHISMELTADGARVTNLSLEGSRLVLTIEAQLAGSQLRSGDAVPPSAAGEKTAQEDRSETEFVFNHHQDAPASGAAGFRHETTIDDVMRNTGDQFHPVDSESGRPAPEPEPIPEAAPAAPAAPMEPESPPAAAGQEPGEDTELLPPMDPQLVAELPEIPPLEPVRELTETWDQSSGSRPTSRLVLDETKREESPTIEPPPITEHPVADTWSGAPVPEAAPAEAAPAETAETAETPDVPPSEPRPAVMTPFLDEEDEELEEPPVVSEESSAIGGERHGEPLPGIAFGMEPPPSEPMPEPEPEPESEPEPAPEPVPEVPPPFPDEGSVAPQPSMEEMPTASPRPPEAGATTVLIRYTCPKCRTQGMQAVDKVGTVVHCSNCGKAMRLVMKK